MLVLRHPGLKKDFKQLRRFRSPLESLEAWELLFQSKGLRETPGIEQYPGFGSFDIFKARVVPLGENCGKSKGYRLIFHIGTSDTCTVLVFSRHGVYKTEQELVNLIKARLVG